jgi:hypothetical protein
MVLTIRARAEGAVVNVVGVCLTAVICDVGEVSPVAQCECACSTMTVQLMCVEKEASERPVKETTDADIGRLDKLHPGPFHWIYPRLPSWWGIKRQTCDVGRGMVPARNPLCRDVEGNGHVGSSIVSAMGDLRHAAACR